MKNREAIEWLKGCVVSYEVDNKGRPNGNITCDLTQEVLDMAISALEKQIPKKPVIGYAFPDKLREVMKRTDPEKAETKTDCCPVCGRTLGVSKFVQTQTGLRFGDPHCKRCGQAIDWEEE